MKLYRLQKKFVQALQVQYPQTEIDTFFQWLCQAKLGYSRFDISLQKERELDKAACAFFNNALLRLQNFEPIQYIIGSTEFYGLPFNVTPHTLIPRPETEELVSWIIADLTLESQECLVPKLNILDIGTGSGCIAISLAKHLEKARILAVDISAEALRVAKLNAQKNGVVVDFKKVDVLKLNLFDEVFDSIVSNPPYVRELEKEKMQSNVLLHEPEGALFVTNKDPLLFYRTIAKLAHTSLKKGGFLYFEINEYLEKEMRMLLTSLDYKAIETKKDIHGKDRMMRCTR